ncbi:MAG TPA: DUF3231 family protein [Bacillales bacterium]|nr:DUF3231 family protein [Bacillales bacterium]
MEIEHRTKLTSAEISQIWSAYQNDTLSACVLEYFLQHVEDRDIASSIEQALQITQSHIQSLETFFREEKFPLPQGFTGGDVNPEAPRLFSDSFMLYYIHQIGMLGMNASSMAVTLSVRPDIHDYFSRTMREYQQVHETATRLLLEKGLYIRPPYIPVPKKVNFITSHDFFGGGMAENRPLIALEISNLYGNIQRNSLGRALLTGFAQVAQSQQVRKYLVRGKEIAAKHLDIFSSVLNKDDLPASVSWDTEVTASTVAPFSDKLMMFHTTALIAIGIGYYGTSLSTCLRKDLAANYSRLTAEIVKYSADGAKLMIDKGWMEEPPQAADRDQLMKKKG